MNSFTHSDVPRGGRRDRILRLLPAVLVMAALIAIAIWGHATGWSFAAAAAVSPPKASPVSLRETSTGLELVFASTSAIDVAGIEADSVRMQPLTEFLTASGLVQFDPSCVAHVTARVEGTLTLLRKSIGTPVAADEIVAVIDSPVVAQTKSDFQQALQSSRQAQRSLERVRLAGVAVAGQQLRDAEAAATEADVALRSREQALHNLGFKLKSTDLAEKSFEQIAVALRKLGLDAASESSSLLPVRASMGGEVLTSDAVRGEAVTAGQLLFTIVDPRRMRLTISIPEAEAKRIQIGMATLFRPDGSRVDSGGKVSAIAPQADAVTRTVAVLVNLPNEEGQLKAGLPGRATVVLQVKPHVLAVPKDAVTTIDGKAGVFVRNPDYFAPGGSKSFAVRPVQLGIADGNLIEITGGLKPGEIIATRGANGLADEIHRQRQTGGRP